MTVENLIGLKGVVVEEIQSAADINGTKQDCCRFVLHTERKSNVADEVIIYYTDKAIEKGLLPFMVGETVLVTGRVQTAKNFKTGQVLTYVLADFVGWIPKTDHENAVQIIGTIAKGTKYRVTPKGKHITSFMLEVAGSLHNTACYIPCIAWGSLADAVKDWQQGTQVEIKGRLQSREFTRRTPEGDEKRVSHELSANNIRKIDKNEKQAPTAV